MSSSTTILGIPISPLTITRTLAGATSLLGLIVAARSQFDPISSTKAFGFPTTSRTVQTAAQNPFIRIAGGRAIGPALGTLLFLATGYEKALGLSLMLAPVTGALDGFWLWWGTRQEVVQEVTAEIDGDVEKKNEQLDELHHLAMERRVEKARRMGLAHLGLTSAIGVVGAVLFVYGES